MVEKIITPENNVVDLASYHRALRDSKASAISQRWCRHCGAALGDDESEDDCSTAGIAVEHPGWARAPRRFFAE
jgi:hypothetical protein